MKSLTKSLLLLSIGLALPAQCQTTDTIVSTTQGPLLPHSEWDCGMPGGIPSPERGELVFTAKIDLRDLHSVGVTPWGHRKVFVTGAGTLQGDKLTGDVLPGGLDFQLSFANDAMEVEQVLVLKASDGSFIYVRSAGTAAAPTDVRIVPSFEAPTSSNYSWLNDGTYVGRRTVNEGQRTLELAIYDVSSIEGGNAAGAPIRVEKPEGLRAQSWDYRQKVPGEQRGDELITELVTLGPSQSVGPTKGGARNIIPITGGNLKGRITGKVLFGGADYQKMGNPFTLDARYLWKTDSGDVIIVRNAGAIGSLVPVFEVSSDSEFAWLNDGTYLSSPPGMGQGGVSLTFYESSQ